jgi:hypothetical protein
LVRNGNRGCALSKPVKLAQSGNHDVYVQNFWNLIRMTTVVVYVQNFWNLIRMTTMVVYVPKTVEFGYYQAHYKKPAFPLLFQDIL